MKILVTGGAGFIGSHISEAYAAQGHEVVSVDNLSTGKIENVPSGVRLEKIDITSSDFDDFMQKEKFEVVNHHAAHMELRVSVERPVHDAQSNILGSLRVLQNAYKFGVRHTVLASSCAVLGELHTFPATEEHTTVPISPYGCSKLAMEIYAQYFRIVHGLSVSTLRYTNVYGPKQNPNGESGVIAIFLQKFLDGKVATIHGEGNQIRDYIHVKDVASANILATEKMLQGTYFVCSGEETSVNRVVELLIASVEVNAEVERGPAMPGDPPRIVCSPSKFQTLTGWSNKTTLDIGIRETTEWFQK
ncbi:MAG: NAD-dependent epimerase/dehydratase family protein [Ignavibacteria bacterium]|nr:NAD-dependent epimerase/dehydratase family protein [Ignavibacteria bacterium]